MGNRSINAYLSFGFLRATYTVCGFGYRRNSVMEDQLTIQNKRH